MSQRQEIEFNLEEMHQISQIFFKESQEIFDDLNRLLLAYEQQPESQFIFNSIYRRIHTIKGSLSAVQGAQIVSSLAHELEEILTKIKN